MAWGRRPRLSKITYKHAHPETYTVSQKGGVRLFDLWDVSHTDSQVEPLSSTLEYTAHEGAIQFEFHYKSVPTSSLDAVGSVGFNPLQSWLLSVAGSRNFDDDASESDDSDVDSEDEGTNAVTVKRCSNTKPVDTSIKLWNFATPQGEQ